MKVHIQEEEIASLSIVKEHGLECNIPAGLYNRYFSMLKSFEEVQSELRGFYGQGEVAIPAPPAPENTTADQIRSEILTELITSPNEFNTPSDEGCITVVAPPKKRLGRPPKVKPEPEIVA